MLGIDDIQLENAIMMKKNDVVPSRFVIRFELLAILHWNDTREERVPLTCV